MIKDPAKSGEAASSRRRTNEVRTTMPKGDVMLSSKGAELVLHALKAGLKKFKRDEIAYPVIENAIQLMKLAAPEGEKCAHWPGQKRCEVCGMGKVKP